MGLFTGWDIFPHTDFNRINLDWILRTMSRMMTKLVPGGGTTGQVLGKISDEDNAVEWVDFIPSGVNDYDEAINKPQINSVTLEGDKSAADLGLGTYSLPIGGIPKTDLDTGVQTSLGLADTALQSAPVTSVNGQTGAVTVSVPVTSVNGQTGDVVISGAEPSDVNPERAGNASPGTDTAYSRGDHVHPSELRALTITNKVSGTQSAFGFRIGSLLFLNYDGSYTASSSGTKLFDTGLSVNVGRYGVWTKTGSGRVFINTSGAVYSYELTGSQSVNGPIIFILG